MWQAATSTLGYHLQKYLDDLAVECVGGPQHVTVKIRPRKQDIVLSRIHKFSNIQKWVRGKAGRYKEFKRPGWSFESEEKGDEKSPIGWGLGQGETREFSRMGIFDIKLQIVFPWNKPLPLKLQEILLDVWLGARFGGKVRLKKPSCTLGLVWVEERRGGEGNS